MAINSESTYFDLKLIRSGKPPQTSFVDEDCRIILPVFVHLADTNDNYRNDFRAPLLTLGDRYNNAKIFIESCSNGLWSEKTQLTDATYGSIHTWTDNNWLGYRLDWHKVFTAWGIGVYRFRFEYTDIINSALITTYSYMFDLKEFNRDIADFTTKLTWKINGGRIGDAENDKLKVDYGDIVWDNEIRLPESRFKFISSEFEKEYTRFQNGGQVWIKDQQVEKYLLNIKRLNYLVHKEIRITALQSGELYISDYNIGNSENVEFKRVIFEGGYEPAINSYTDCSSVELDFEPFYQNLQRKRC